MSEAKTKILDRLSKGDITVQEAEEELNKLPRGKKGFLPLGDFFLDFDCNRIILEDVHTGTLELGPVELDLASANGSIKVETWDSDEYQLTVTKRVKAHSEEQAESICSEFSFAEINGNSIRAGDQDYNQKKVSISILLKLPQTNPVQGKVITANGSITVAGIENKGLSASSANGSIRMESISGGEIQANTVNGSIKILGSNQVSAGTTNGSITLNSPKLCGHTKLKTVNGSIRAAVPANPGSALEVVASATSGRVTLDHPLIAHNRKVRGQAGSHIEARSPNWDQTSNQIRLELSTVNGSISVKEADPA